MNHPPKVVMKFGKPYIWDYTRDGKAVLRPLLKPGPRDENDISPAGGIGPMPASIREHPVELSDE